MQHKQKAQISVQSMEKSYIKLGHIDQMACLVFGLMIFHWTIWVYGMQFKVGLSTIISNKNATHPNTPLKLLFESMYEGAIFTILNLYFFYIQQKFKMAEQGGKKFRLQWFILCERKGMIALLLRFFFSVALLLGVSDRLTHR